MNNLRTSGIGIGTYTLTTTDRTCDARNTGDDPRDALWNARIMPQKLPSARDRRPASKTAHAWHRLRSEKLIAKKSLPVPRAPVTMAPALPSATSPACTHTITDTPRMHTNTPDSTPADGLRKLINIATLDPTQHMHNRTHLFPSAQQLAQASTQATNTTAPPEPAQHPHIMPNRAPPA